MMKQIALQRGYNLLEVLIGVLIFAIGMLALSSLQGNLTRSAADANFRTVAVNIAEELIESRRGFARIATDPDGVFPAYDDIVDEVVAVTRGGVEYDVDIQVTDYFYDLATDSFTTVAPPSVIVSDYKLLSLTVTWTAPEFRTVEGEQTEGRLGSGTLTVVETISSVTSAAASKVATQETADLPTPLVDYNPGEKPDIVSISLGENKFKESLLPEPDVIKVDEFVETRFDVITYSQTNEGALFLRREEFIAISCECIMQAAPIDAESGGRRPTIWAGDEYAEGHFVAKPYGVGALGGNQQSPFCEVCCRDHHDGGNHEDDDADAAANLYDPWRPVADYHVGGAFPGDHKHYNRVQQGNNPPTLALVEVAGEVYIEACKLVRKDGFFRVAQDFRQEDLNVFPADFLDDQAEVETYSAYVTAAADAYEDAADPGYEFAADPPCIGEPGCDAVPVFGGDYPIPLAAGQFPTWSPLPLGGEETQQLRSRGIYIDYLSADLRAVVDCLRNNEPLEQCKQGKVELDQTESGNILEIIPFYDVQLTWLYRWNEWPNNIPVDTTNEGLEDDNAHSRGVASRDWGNVVNIGCSDVESTGHKGNLGFTDTAAVDENYVADLREAILDVESLDEGGFSPCIPLNGDEPVISGEISETVPGLKATDIEVVGLNGALCDRTPNGYECIIPDFAVNPLVKIYGYGKAGVNRWGCSLGPNLLVLDSIDHGEFAYATFRLSTPEDPQPDGPGYNLNVEPNACGE